MRPLIQSIVVATLLLCGLPAPVEAQMGSNYDPPPPGAFDTPPPPPPNPAPKPPPEPPFWRQIDYADPSNLVKIALLLGSIIIARRAFQEMKED